MTELIGDALPTDNSRQVLADDYIEREIGRPAPGGAPWRVLDLGCGIGDSVDYFRARDPDVDWIGIDVPGSPEARTEPAPTPASRPSTASRSRSPTAASSSFTASRCSSTCVTPNRC